VLEGLNMDYKYDYLVPRMMLEIVDCLNDHFQILGVASGNKDEDYEHL